MADDGPELSGSLTDVPGILVGHAQDEVALTGCTAVIAAGGAVAGVDVRGAGAGTRELDVLAPTAAIERVHGICLAGGSAFGLDAAGGVVAYLEEQGIGYNARGWRVPIVPSAIIYDLNVGDGRVRPDKSMGYAAAAHASGAPVAEGNVGAGCGASAGKLAGAEWRVKAGVGCTSERRDGLIVAALAVVNAIGSIADPETGDVLAGPPLEDAATYIAMREREHRPGRIENTTLVVVATNARLTKAGATRVARVAHDGIARVVFPAHLSGDGDVAFVLSVGEHSAGADLVATLAIHAVSRAIVRGVRRAAAAGGLPSTATARPS